MRTLFLFLALSGAALGQDGSAQLSTSAGCGAAHPGPMTADEHKWCDEHKLAPANPELDAANKKIAELTAQLEKLTAAINLYRGDYQACHDQLIMTVAQQQPQQPAPAK